MDERVHHGRYVAVCATDLVKDRFAGHRLLGGSTQLRALEIGVEHVQRGDLADERLVDHAIPILIDSPADKFDGLHAHVKGQRLGIEGPHRRELALAPEWLDDQVGIDTLDLRQVVVLGVRVVPEDAEVHAVRGQAQWLAR